MAKVLKILGTVSKVMAFIIFTVTALLCLTMAYIMFAPDDLPKPFRLTYQYPLNAPSYMPVGVQPPEGMVATLIPTPEPTKVVNPGEGVMVNMSTKIINLEDPSGRKYIRLTVVLEFAPDFSTEATATTNSAENSDPNAAFIARVNARMPMMDDVVITLLSTKTFEDLYTADGKEALRKEILEAINARLPDFRVISVYFTEFVVQ